MSGYVLDASVAAKWFLPGDRETLREEATAILEQYAAGRVQLLVPDLFWPEMGNILWKAARTGRMTTEDAQEAMAGLRRQQIQTAPTLPLLEHALAIALRFGRTVYDSVYVALAVLSGRMLVTADEKLANAVAAHFPVRWLGAL